MARSAPPPAPTVCDQACPPIGLNAGPADTVPTATRAVPPPGSTTGEPVATPTIFLFQRQTEIKASPSPLVAPWGAAPRVRFVSRSPPSPDTGRIMVPEASGTGSTGAAAAKLTVALKWWVRLPLAQVDGLVPVSTALTTLPFATRIAADEIPTPQSVTSKVRSAESSRKSRVPPWRPQVTVGSHTAAGRALA